jgi:hypothetical protein
MTWKTWVLIIIVLAILGFNIFTYLAKGTQFTANIFNQITSWFSGLFGNNATDTAKQTINVSATGAKAGVDAVATTTTNAIDAVSNPNLQTNINTNYNPPTAAPKQAYSSQPGQPIQQIEKNQEDSLNKALNNAQKDQSVQADDSYSTIQMSKSAGKTGWCYIGDDRGIRSCMEVGPNDMCMSGDIFPTNDVCVNPNLRT